MSATLYIVTLRGHPIRFRKVGTRLIHEITARDLATPFARVGQAANHILAYNVDPAARIEPLVAAAGKEEA